MMKKKYSKILLCTILIVGLLYTPVAIPQLANTQMVAEAEAATVKLNKKKTTVAVGNTVKLKMSGTKKKVKWTSSNRKVATVTSKGVVKGRKAGTATIKAKVGGRTYKCKVTVKKSITTAKKTVTISKAGKTAKVVITIRGKGKAINQSTNRSVATSKWKKKWKGAASSKTKTNTLIITAKKPGTAYIRLTNSVSKEVVKIKVIVPKPAPAPKPEPAPAVYTITYELNKGINAAENPGSYTAGTAVTLQAPTRDHYDFAGWYLNPDFSTPFEAVTESTTGDLTLYAKWEKSVLNVHDPAYVAMAQVKPENQAKAKSYIDKLYYDNAGKNQLSDQFTWEPVTRKSNWIYYTGLVHEGLLTMDFERYAEGMKPFYTQHIKDDGSIRNYTIGELDSAMPGANLFTYLRSDKLTETERVQYEKAVNYIYRQLENQTVYEDAGMLMLHSQQNDGTPRFHWAKWNICLDGIYMSQMFLIRMAEAIDDGLITVTRKDGKVVDSSEIWNDVYSRMTFVMETFRDKETGLLNHGYSVASKEVNNGFWSRGMGWYTMVLMEAASKMPDSEKKAALTAHYGDLMTSIMEWQDPKSFLWYNVTDGREEVGCTNKDGKWIGNKPEASGSAMFAYCLLRGYHDGLLQGEAYRSAGLCAFNALTETLLKEEGLTDVYSSSSVTSDRNKYQVNDYAVNDGKGVGPYILAAKYAY